MAASDLYTQAASLLEACEDLLGARAPAVSFVSPGPPVFDCCPMLSVHVSGINEGGTPPPGALGAGHRYTSARVNQVGLVVSIVRCDQESSAGVFPDVAKKEETAAEVYEDIWTLWNGLNRMSANGELFQGCGERFFDGARPITPSGGCVGFLFLIRLTLPGFDPTV